MPSSLFYSWRKATEGSRVIFPKVTPSYNASYKVASPGAQTQRELEFYSLPLQEETKFETVLL